MDTRSKELECAPRLEIGGNSNIRITIFKKLIGAKRI